MKKYKLLNESLKAIKDKSINLLILKGNTGMGKTHTTLDYAKENNLNYEYINTYLTPLSFYKILYHSRGKDLIIFDDLKGINEGLIISMIKAACWVSEDNKREINYYSTSSTMKKENLPESFEFNASIILIFNDSFNGFESILDRGISIDFNFSFDEKIEILENFKDVTNIDDEVLLYIKKNCSGATTNLSIRTAVILSKLKNAGHDFKIFAEEILKTNDDLRDLMNLSEEEWCDKNGKTRATYFRHKKKLK